MCLQTKPAAAVVALAGTDPVGTENTNLLAHSVWGRNGVKLSNQPINRQNRKRKRRNGMARDTLVTQK